MNEQIVQTKTPMSADAHPLLFEMLRSFTTLAKHLNLSHAVAELNSTRQTVRRHIAQLEEAKGIQLFTVRDRRYELTEEGAAALPDALDLLARGSAWVRGQMELVNGLQYLAQHDDQGWRFFMQQQPVSRAFDSKSPLLSETVRAWAIAGGHIEHPALEHVRRHLIVYRDTPFGWVCIELGEMSSFVLWFGWAQARSSIGRPIGELPGGGTFARLLQSPFEEIKSTHGVRLDHIHTLLPRGPGGAPIAISYERLLMGGRLPDNSFAMLSVVDCTNEVEIKGVDGSMLEELPEDVILPAGTVERKFASMA